MGYTKEIHYDRIEFIMTPAGGGGRFLSDITREMKTEMEVTSPRRSGQLARSFVNAGQRNVGKLKVARRINNTAPQALWVSEGTRDYTGKWMRIPRRAQDYSYSRRRRADRGSIFGNAFGPRPRSSLDSILTRTRAGQRANPFIQTAVTRVLARHRIL